MLKHPKHQNSDSELVSDPRLVIKAPLCRDGSRRPEPTAPRAHAPRAHGPRRASYPCRFPLRRFPGRRLPGLSSACGGRTSRWRPPWIPANTGSFFRRLGIPALLPLLLSDSYCSYFVLFWNISPADNELKIFCLLFISMELKNNIWITQQSHL